MIWAIISRFGFFQISVSLIRELTRATSGINECARLYEILLAHRAHTALLPQFVRFWTVLSESWTPA